MERSKDLDNKNLKRKNPEDQEKLEDQKKNDNI